MFVKFGIKYRPLMFDSRVDLCALYRGIAEYEFLPVLELDAEAENISDGCPVSGTRFVRNLRLRKTLYPSVLPEGEFRLENTVYTRDSGSDERLLNAVMWFVVRHNDSRLF